MFTGKKVLKDQQGRREAPVLEIKVSQNTPVNPKWKQFLCDDDNKTELFKLLAQDLASIIMPGKQIVCTIGQDVVTNDESVYVETIMPCNNEEADTQVLLHIKNQSEAGHDVLTIKTVDTDVAIIATYFLMLKNFG